MTVAQTGDLVLLLGRDFRRFQIRLEENGRMQTHHGVLKHADLIGLPYGSEVRTHLGYLFFLLRPTTADIVQDLKRSGQILFPKDLGYILIKLGIAPGSRVLECGTGSGALTLTLARAVGPHGHVYSYDVRADMQSLARKNVEQFGLGPQVTFKLRDAAEGFDETDVDALFLDMPEPWLFLDQALAALSGGGVLGGLLPTMNQIVELSAALHCRPFAMIDIEELLLRPYKTAPGRVRPIDRMIAHTGYLYFARKLLRRVEEPGPETAPEAAAAAAGDEPDDGVYDSETGAQTPVND
jgi:tRNA (adenine57-N1/adenine58-N1)-methyltransferase